MHGLDSRNVDGPAKSNNHTEALREAKRKHPPSGMINGAQLGSVLQGLRKVSNHQAQHTLEDGPISVGLANPGAGEGSNTQHPPLSVSLFEFVPNEGTTVSSAECDQQWKDASKFQFNAKPWSVMGTRPRHAFREVSIDLNVGCGVGQIEGKNGLEVDGVVDGSDCMVGVQEKGAVHNGMAANCNLGNGQKVCHEALTTFPNGHEVVGSPVSYGDGFGNRADEGMVEVDRMEFDGGGDANAV
nr:hypothetical protein CFP56_27734 [Quercus suber]